MCLWDEGGGGACEQYRVQLGSGEVVLLVVANGTEPTQVRGRGVGVAVRWWVWSCGLVCVVCRCMAQ